MKNPKGRLLNYLLIIWGFIIPLNAIPAFGQSSDIDFTDLHSPVVTCYYGSFDNPFKNTGIVNGRHTVIHQQGLDPNTCDMLPYLPPNESKVIRLGNADTGAEAEAISYKFTVDHFKSILLLKFAVVFEDPEHTPAEQPRFVVKVLNVHGQLVEECAEYDVTAAGSIPGFNSCDIVRWRPWTNIGIDLSPYIGQIVQVQFITYDCERTGHFGYAYFTASCIENHLSIKDCEDETITLTAPDDFVSYQWDNGDTTQESEYSVSNTSTDASCIITSVTGCQFTLHAHITKETGLPTEDLVIHDTICLGDSYQENYFNIAPQNQIGDFIFINTLFDLNNCVGDADIVLLLHVSDSRPYFTSNIEGAQNVHVSTNLFTGEYLYTIEKIPNITDYVWAISNQNWLLYPNQNECRVIVTTLETAILTVEARNNCGSDSRSISINATFFDVDEIGEQVANVYPNPTCGQLTIEGQGILKLSVSNVVGQIMKEFNGGGRDKINMDISDLENGFYILVIEGSNYKTQKQIAVSR